MTQNNAAAEIDLTHAGEMGDRLFPLLDRLRETDPIHWNETARCWVVTRHQDIVDALAGRVPMSNVRQATASYAVIPPAEWPQRLPNLVKYAPHHITNVDPPQHTRLRTLLSRAFVRPVVENLRPFAQTTVAGLMAVLADGRPVEFNHDVALALPGNVILKLLGFGDALYGRLRVWANDVMVGLGTAHPQAEWVEAADRAFAEMTEHFLAQIADRRRSPRGPEDFISALIAAKDGKDALSDEEIVAVLQVALVAGHDTTVNSMTLGVAALARHPDAWRYMREHPHQIMESVLELMRFSSMSTAQNRVVAADFDWHGKRLRKGDTVFLMLGAGNRDPLVYTNPEVLDLRRRNDMSLMFAPGLHHCIGHLLAKMQLTEFFGALTEHFDGAEILDAEVRFSPVLAFRSIPSLHMRFLPRMRVAG
jgi:pimeloyl-[acyl-carrier protein] synthase